MGRKVKVKKLQHIGIINSGIDGLFVKKFGVKINSAAVFGIDNSFESVRMVEYHKKEIEDWKKGIVDHLSEDDGSGSAVLSIIWRRFPFAKYSIAKIPEVKNSFYSRCLLEALKWMIEDVKPEVINVSIGTADATIKKELYYLTERARKNDITIYVSGSRNISFPAVFDTVITVMDEATIADNCSWFMQLSVDKIVKDEVIKVWRKDCWRKEKLISAWSSAMVLGL